MKENHLLPSSPNPFSQPWEGEPDFNSPSPSIGRGGWGVRAYKGDMLPS